MGKADFNQMIRLRNQLVIARKNFPREENSSTVLIPALSKDMNEQLKLSHKVVDVVDRAKRKICMTLLRCIVDNPKSSYAQVRIFARKKEDEKFQQNVVVKYTFEEFIYILDVLISVYDNVIANKPICCVLQKVVTSIRSLSFFFFFSGQHELDYWK